MRVVLNSTLPIFVAAAWFGGACSTAVACPEGVGIRVSGNLGGVIAETCVLSWQSNGKTGEVQGFWDTGEGYFVGKQNGFPDSGINESMDSLNAEFVCDGAILFAGVVPIVWEWEPDCNQKVGVDETEYLVGAIEIVLPQ